jgi:hypothetical protein
MHTVQVIQAHATRIPFVSACPHCGQEQAQWFTHGALLRLLARGHPVEGYCVFCDDYWQISARERRDLAAKVPGLTRESALMLRRHSSP